MKKCVSMLALGLIFFCQPSFSADSVVFVSTKNNAWYVADPFFNKCEDPKSKCISAFAHFDYYYLENYHNGARIEANTSNSRLLGLRLKWTGGRHDEDMHQAYLNFYKVVNNSLVSCNIFITQQGFQRPEQVTIQKINGPCKMKHSQPGTLLELELN